MDIRKLIAAPRRDMLPFIIFGLAFCVRLLYFFEMRHHPFFHVLQLDERLYDEWAVRIAGGDWLGGDRVYGTTPLYPYLLAVLYKIVGHDLDAVRLVQITTGSFTWVITYLIGKRLVGRRSAFIGAVAGCFYGYSVFSDCQILKHSLAMTTFVMTLLTAMNAREQDSNVLRFATGFLLGLTAVNQANTLLLLPLFAAAAFFGKHDARLQLRSGAAALVMAGLVLVVAPVTIRNYLVEGDLTLITYNGGPAFYIGNNRESDGGLYGGELSTSTVPQNREMSRYIGLAERNAGRKLKPSEASNYWYSRGAAFIRDNPGQAAMLMGRKLLLFWNWYELPDNVDFYYMRSQSTVLRFAFVSFTLISPLALLGVFLSLREWRRHLLPHSLIAVFMISIIAFLVTARYRVTILPLFCVYAAGGIDAAVGSLRTRNWRLAVTATVFFCAALFATSRTILYYPMEHSRQMLGNIFFQNRMYPEAYAEYKSSIRVFPLTFNRSLKFNFASAATQVGALDEALDQYRQLLMYPDLDSKTRAGIYSNISSVLTRKGDRYGAAAAAQEAAFMRRTLAK